MKEITVLDNYITAGLKVISDNKNKVINEEKKRLSNISTGLTKFVKDYGIDDMLKNRLEQIISNREIVEKDDVALIASKLNKSEHITIYCGSEDFKNEKKAVYDDIYNEFQIKEFKYTYNNEMTPIMVDGFKIDAVEAFKAEVSLLSGEYTHFCNCKLLREYGITLIDITNMFFSVGINIEIVEAKFSANINTRSPIVIIVPYATDELIELVESLDSCETEDDTEDIIDDFKEKLKEYV